MVPYSGFLSLIAGKYVSISGKLSREKPIVNVKNTTFEERTFVDCSFLPHQIMSHLQILRRKLSRIATKP